MTVVGRKGLGDDRWVLALHNLYLATLLIAFVDAMAVEPIAPALTAEQRAAVLGVAAAGLAAADLLLRRWQGIGYFLCVAIVVGTITSICPLFQSVAFGALPLAFVTLQPFAAVATGLVLTASPMVVQPLLMYFVFDDREPFGVAYKGSFVNMAVISVALPLLIGLLTARAIRARQVMAEQLSAARERQRLAHELHDTLTQGLSGVIMQLEAAEQDLLPHRLTRARELARSCLADTRRAVESLRPVPLDDRTLAEAIAEQCLQWTERSGITVRFALRGSARRLHPDVEVTVLRVTQEALTNAVKHARASRMDVVLDYRNGLRLTVTDDGRGFDPETVWTPEGGLGLPTMRERVDSVGGRFTVTSSPAGTVVVAEVATE